MQKARSSGYQPTYGKSKNKTQYSQCWLRELEQQQCTNCGISLSWMESEGYTPLKVTVQNNTTGDTEIININLDELLGPHGSSASEDEINTLKYDAVHQR